MTLNDMFIVHPIFIGFLCNFPCLRFLAPISPAWPWLPRSSRPSHLGALAVISLHHVVSWLLDLPTEFEICEWHKHQEFPPGRTAALSQAHDGTTNSSSNSHQNYLGWTFGERIWLTKPQKYPTENIFQHLKRISSLHRWSFNMRKLKDVVLCHFIRPWNRFLENPWCPTCITKAPSMLHTNSCSCPHLSSRHLWLTYCDMFQS